MKKRPIRVDIIRPILDDETFSREERSSRTPKTFHASGIESCGRQQWYGLKGYAAEPRMENPEYIRDASAGNGLHEQYQELLVNSGFVIDLDHFFLKTGWRKSDYDSNIILPEWSVEVPLPPNEYQIGGRIDAVIQIEDSPIIVDIKTLKDKAFGELPGGYKFKKFYAQMQVYMHLTGIHQSIVLAVNRNDSLMKEYVVEYDKEWCESQFKRIEHLKKLLDDDVLPVMEPSFFECKFCPFSALCFMNAGGKSYEEPEGIIRER